MGGIFSGVLGGLIAAAVTMLGWFATAYLRRGEERRQFQLGFLERQILELYAPLYILALTENKLRNLRDTLAALEANRDKPVWPKYSEKWVVPLQKEILALLKAKWHLIRAGDLKESFVWTIEHCTETLSLYDLSAEGLNVAPAGEMRVMPNALAGDVGRELHELRMEHDRLAAEALVPPWQLLRLRAASESKTGSRAA